MCAQFPDPHYRPQRHPVTEAFVHACAEALEQGGCVWLQSDIESTAVFMRHIFWHSFEGSTFAPHPVHFEPGASWRCTTGAVLKAHVADRGSVCHVGEKVCVAKDLWSQHHDAMASSPPAAAADGAFKVVQEAGYEHGAWPNAGWLRHNVWHAPTEREYYHASVTGAPVFRVLLQKQ